jgi:NAD(P)-dependent dehydrogenase (short-subunit alcohol dehydrogenase family)
MLLESRNAVVYGAAGALGSAVSRAFAREGAAVFLTGRRRAPLEAVATKIRAVGGAAEVAVVDADSEQAVEEHAHAVVDQAGSLDISINLIGVDHIQGRPFGRYVTGRLHARPRSTGAYPLCDGAGSGTAHDAAAIGCHPDSHRDPRPARHPRGR